MARAAGVPAAVLEALRRLRELPECRDLAVLAGTSSWLRFGVRDPAILSNADGVVQPDDDGSVTMFFNGRDRGIAQGGVTQMGMARWRPGLGFAPEPMPVLQDGAYAAQGSVLRISGDEYRCYYSPDTGMGFRVARSPDGHAWFVSRDLVLTPDQFGASHIGLPNVIRIGSRWRMVFEGVVAGRFRIFMAGSADGFAWTPSNNGEPIYTPAPEAWDSFGQANPSLYPIASGSSAAESFTILYNGCPSAKAWDLGVLTAGSLDGPWRPDDKPFLRREQIGDFAAGRLEGARLMYCGGEWRLVFFGLPGRDSYQDGKVLSLRLDVTER